MHARHNILHHFSNSSSFKVAAPHPHAGPGLLSHLCNGPPHHIPSVVVEVIDDLLCPCNKLIQVVRHGVVDICLRCIVSVKNYGMNFTFR